MTVNLAGRIAYCEAQPIERESGTITETESFGFKDHRFKVIPGDPRFYVAVTTLEKCSFLEKIKIKLGFYAKLQIEGCTLYFNINSLAKRLFGDVRIQSIERNKESIQQAIANNEFSVQWMEEQARKGQEKFNQDKYNQLKMTNEDIKQYANLAAEMVETAALLGNLFK
jgi:hypothetical protein